MAGFVGRARELKLLADLSATVASGSRTGRPGKALLIRGRRRVGKSRLVEEFVGRTADLGLRSQHARAGAPNRYSECGGPGRVALPAFWRSGPMARTIGPI